MDARAAADRAGCSRNVTSSFDERHVAEKAREWNDARSRQPMRALDVITQCE